MVKFLVIDNQNAVVHFVGFVKRKTRVLSVELLDVKVRNFCMRPRIKIDCYFRFLLCKSFKNREVYVGVYQDYMILGLLN